MYYGKTRSKMIANSRREAVKVILSDFNKILGKYLKFYKDNMVLGK